MKKISSEHFNLCEAEMSLDEIIKFRWNHKVLQQIINLQLMMALQQNFKRVLLNCAPRSIHLHPAHLNLHPALCNTLNVIRTKILDIIWQFSKISANKFRVVHFDKKIGTYGILVVLIPNLVLKFWNSDPKIQYLGKFGPENSKLTVLSKNAHIWYLEDPDSYSNISFLNFQP